jgi:hypothetical protein
MPLSSGLADVELEELFEFPLFELELFLLPDVLHPQPTAHRSVVATTKFLTAPDMSFLP